MINAVICEFNPFHNGHKYLLESAAEKTGADATVCLMSGNFVQRGEPAVCEKHIRAAAAVKNGADLVLQIPTAHTLAGASVFAAAGVSMADALGLETSLCFGSEAEDISPLYKLAATDRQQLSRAFKSRIAQGKSYARAVMEAYGECAGENAEILRHPNNLLAFEYIKAITELKSDIRPVNILRRGSGHDSDKPQNGFASASYLRAHRHDDISEYVPQQPVYSVDNAKFDTLLLYSVYSKTAHQLSAYADMGEGLNNRVYACAFKAANSEQLISLIKSKRYTHSRIRRAVLNVLLENPAGLYKTPVKYMSVLAFNDRGRQLLKKLTQSCSIPIITKPSKVLQLKDAKAHFELEHRASDIYDFCSVKRRGKGREYTISPVYVR